MVAFIGATAFAQPGNIEGTELEIESILIDAGREKLLGNYQEAIDLYKEILEKDSENAVAAYEVARLFANQENLEQAVEHAQMATRFDPTNNWYLQLLADLYQQTGQFVEGAGIYRQLRERQPDNRDYYYKQAFFLVRANELKDAQRVYSDLENRIGISEDLIRRRHTLYLGMGNLKKAGQELDKLTDAFPDNIDYWHLLADFHQKTGNPKDAQKAFERILEIDPNDAKAKLAMAGGDLKRRDEVTYLNNMRPVFEDPGTLLDLKVGRLMPIIEKVSQSGNLELADAALGLTSILEEVHPGQAKAYAASGDLYYLTNRPVAAARKYQKALELDDSNFLLWENLFAALKDSGNTTGLTEWTEEAMFVFPNQATVFYLNGYALQASKQPEDALDVLNEALFMSGKNELLQQTIISCIGLSYEQSGDTEQADDAFRKAIEINPDYPLARARYAFALARRGDQKARDYAEKALSAAVLEAEVLHLSSWSLYLTGQAKKALDFMAQAVQKTGKTNPLYLEHYGDILFKAGQEEEALKYWNLARDRGSESDVLERKIADKKLYK